MPQPDEETKTVVTEPSPEELMSTLEPAGGLKNMLDMMLPPEEKEEDKKEEKVDDKKEEEEKKEEEIPTGLEKMKPEELVLEVKKHQTIANDWDKKYKELEAKHNELTSKQGTITDEKFTNFLKEFRTDPTKAYTKFQKELELPDINVFKSLVATPTDTVVKLKNYQESVLRPMIEEKFKFDKGTFKFDADEAEDPTTASALWRKMSREKERELDNEVSEAIKLHNEQTKKAQEGQVEDRKWIADNFYGGDEAKAGEAIKELHSIPLKIMKGEANPSQHPFRLRTLWLGANHDTLVKQAVDKAVEDTEKKIMDAYAKEGLYLKNPAPDDLKTIKKAQSNTQKHEYTGNPAEDMMLRTLNQN